MPSHVAVIVAVPGFIPNTLPSASTTHTLLSDETNETSVTAPSGDIDVANFPASPNALSDKLSLFNCILSHLFGVNTRVALLFS